ncbi:MAG: pseudouridine synthase [Victivallaceae bacterium]|nr:pseudouridine synthase [Victivallaceae bacterium]
MEKTPETMRLCKAIAACNFASRRGAADLVRAGRISVNGQIVRDLSTQVGPEDVVALDGTAAPRREEHLSLMFHKPRGYVCSHADMHGEHLIYELLPPEYRQKHLFSAGRLDCDSEGLLILTDDGEYAQKLMHPRYEILKRYLVQLDRPLDAAELARLRNGVEDLGEFLRPLSVTLAEGEKEENCYWFVLNEGRKREIRRLCRAVHRRVQMLRRCSSGLLELGDLAPGKVRKLSEEEIARSLCPRAVPGGK